MTAEEMTKLGIPAEYHGEKLFQDAPDLPTVFKVARDLNTYKGSSIRVPGPEASEADKKEFADKLKKHAPTLLEVPEDAAQREAALLGHLGVPKEEKEYAAADLPEPVLARLRAEAKEEGLTKRQFERRVEREKAAMKAATEKETENVTALKKELGQAFEERLTSAAAAAKKLGASDEEVEAIRTGKAPVETSRRYLAFSKALGTEPGDLGGHSGSGPGKLTPEEINARIQEIYRKPEMSDPAAPGRAKLVEKLYEYQRMLE